MRKTAKPREPRAALTLIELLSVIVLLAMLWAVVFPATDAVRRSSLRRQAKAEAQAIANAILNYRDTYGHWPQQNEIDDAQRAAGAKDVVWGRDLDENTDFILLDQADLIRTLTPASEEIHRADNPRQIAFLELDTDRVSEEGYYCDPWSSETRLSPYIVAVDADGDGWIGATTGERDGDAVKEVAKLRVTQTATRLGHDIPPAREPVYVFSWTGGHSNRVSTLPAR